MTDDPFLTSGEMLDYLQVNLQTVYRLIKSGQIAPVRVGRQWLFRKSDIDAWMASGQPLGESGREDASMGAPPRILVVDDEPAVRELLSRSLSGAGYLVDSAEDGAAGLARLRERRCDLLITDLKMPGMDGLSLVREARGVAPDLPVIIITGYSSESAAIEAIELGVAGYLTKPFRLPRVLAAVARALGEPVVATEA